MSPPSTESERDGAKETVHAEDYITTPRGNPSFEAPLASARKTSTLAYHRSSALHEGRDRVGGAPRSRGLIMVIPPAVVCKDQGPLGHALASGPAHRLSHGMLMPLLPTVYNQLTAIAKEWAFPSTVGLCLYLHMSEGGMTFTPRILDDTWHMLWNHVFDTTLPMSGIPVAGRIEFDIDMSKARWFQSWARESTPDRATPSIPREPSMHHVPHSSVTLSIKDDTTVDSEGVHTVAARHVPKKLSLVDRFDSFTPKTPALRPLRTGVLPEPSALPTAAHTQHHQTELSQKVNKWRADAHVAVPEAVAVVANADVDEEEKSEIDMNDYAWSISSAGPPSGGDWEALESPYRLPSVHMDRRMASSVCLTASVCTSWGPGDSIYSPFEFEDRSPFPLRYGPDDCPNTPSTATSWGAPLSYPPSPATPFYVHTPDVAHRSFFDEDTILRPIGAFSWPYYDVPAEISEEVPLTWPYYTAEQAFTWPYYFAEKAFSWPYYAAEEAFSWPYYTAEKKFSWPYNLENQVHYPHFNIYYLISPEPEQPTLSTVLAPSYPRFEVYTPVYPHFSLYPPVAADNMPKIVDTIVNIDGFWTQRSREYPHFMLYPCSGYPHFDIYPEESTVPKALPSVSIGHEGSASYPILEIYPAVYPYFNLYPEIAGKNEIDVFAEPKPDFWVQRVAGYPDFNLYPSKQYPHFDLYVEELVLVQEKKQAPVYNPGPAYSYPVIEVYPPVYPYFSLYPSAAAAVLMTQKKHDFWVAPQRGYPTFNLYPSTGYPDFDLYPIASTSKLTLDDMARNENSGVYPWLQIYAPVYPFVTPYVQTQASPVRRREVTIAEALPTPRLRPAASLRMRSGTVSSKRHFMAPLTLGDNPWGEPVKSSRSSSRPPLSPTSASNTPRSTRTYALPSSTLPSASIYEPENELPASAASHRRNRSAQVFTGEIFSLERAASSSHVRSKSEKFDTGAGLTRFASLSTPTRSSSPSTATISYAARKRDSITLNVQKWRKTKDMAEMSSVPPLPVNLD